MDKQKTSEAWTISEEYESPDHIPAEATRIKDAVNDLVMDMCDRFAHVTVEVTVKGWDE